jgi:hypothetical protein
VCVFVALFWFFGSEERGLWWDWVTHHWTAPFWWHSVLQA